MISITRVKAFEASHRYFNPAFSEKDNRRMFGKCFSPYGHGHNYVCELTVTGQADRRTGMVVNIKDLDRVLDEITSPLDHKFLNLDVDAFRAAIPTTENIARYLWYSAGSRLSIAGNDVTLARVRVFEEENLFAEYGGGDDVLLTRTYHFSAAHRLHSATLSDEENRAVFGKCNNLYGHGHNYEIDVSIAGPVDESTGMIADLGALDAAVKEAVLDPFDHKHLNHEVPQFADLNPTSENVVRVIWELLQPRISFARIEKVVLRETPKSCFEYRGE